MATAEQRTNNERRYFLGFRKHINFLEHVLQKNEAPDIPASHRLESLGMRKAREAIMLRNLYLTKLRCYMSKKDFLQFLEKTLQVNCYLTQIDMGDGRIWAFLNNFINNIIRKKILMKVERGYRTLKDALISWMLLFLAEKKDNK